MLYNLYLIAVIKLKLESFKLIEGTAFNAKIVYTTRPF